MHGVVADASVNGTLVVRDAVLSSVRVLRDYAAWESHPYLRGRALALARRMELALG